GRGSPNLGDALSELAANCECPVPVAARVCDAHSPGQPLGAEADADSADEANFELRLGNKPDAEARNVNHNDFSGRRVIVVAEENPAGGLAGKTRPAAPVGSRVVR